MTNWSKFNHTATFKEQFSIAASNFHDVGLSAQPRFCQSEDWVMVRTLQMSNPVNGPELRQGSLAIFSEYIRAKTTHSFIPVHQAGNAIHCTAKQELTEVTAQLVWNSKTAPNLFQESRLHPSEYKTPVHKNDCHDLKKACTCLLSPGGWWTASSSVPLPRINGAENQRVFSHRNPHLATEHTGPRLCVQEGSPAPCPPLPAPPGSSSHEQLPPGQLGLSQVRDSVAVQA